MFFSRSYEGLFLRGDEKQGKERKLRKTITARSKPGSQSELQKEASPSKPGKEVKHVQPHRVAGAFRRKPCDLRQEVAASCRSRAKERIVTATARNDKRSRSSKEHRGRCRDSKPRVNAGVKDTVCEHVTMRAQAARGGAGPDKPFENCRGRPLPSRGGARDSTIWDEATPA